VWFLSMDSLQEHKRKFDLISSFVENFIIRGEENYRKEKNLRLIDDNSKDFHG
jgi:hypothetical protein